MRVSLLAALGFLIIASAAMAKPTHVEIVTYAKDCTAKKINIDLIATFGADFRGIDLRGIDLRGASVYHETNWRGADLADAKLENAVLTGVNLNSANLVRANLKGAFLGSAKLAQACLDDANLDEAHLSFAEMKGGSAKRARFSLAEISAARFIDVDLSGADLRKIQCQWYPPDFQGANLTDANLEGAEFLPGADFSNANLRRANFRGARLVRADFSGANLANVIFTEANVQHALFEGVTGISDEELAALNTKSERWKYEVDIFVHQVLGIAHILAFLLAPPIAIWLGIFVRFHSDSPLQKRFGTGLVWLNGIGLLALFILYAFHFFGSQVAQFNAGDAARMAAWSFWFRFWPILMLTLELGFCVSALCSLCTLVGIYIDARCWWRLFVASILAMLHFALEIQYIGKFFPTA